MSPSLSADTSRGLAWPELIPGILLKRYKRFLADVKLESGEIVTAHCPNTGSMMGCCEPGRPITLIPSMAAGCGRRLKMESRFWPTMFG